MAITANELRNNLEKYLELATNEDVFVKMDDGEIIVKLTSAKNKKAEDAKSLFGILPKDVSLQEAREGRFDK